IDPGCNLVTRHGNVRVGIGALSREPLETLGDVIDREPSKLRGKARCLRGLVVFECLSDGLRFRARGLSPCRMDPKCERKHTDRKTPNRSDSTKIHRSFPPSAA